MASSATCDLEALLAPISEAAPAGVDLREDTSPTSVYYQLKDARGLARAAERRADAAGETVEPGEWNVILDLAPQVLATQSKDLEVAAWYIEALLRRHGFPGLRDGFLLAGGLVDRFWDSFHSLKDEEGLPTRLAPLAGLNGVESEGTLIQPMRRAPVTSGREDGPFSIYHYEQAYALSQVADAAAKQRRIDRGDITMERFTAAVVASGGQFYATLIEDLTGAQSAFKALTVSLETKAGPDAPPSSTITDLLAGILTTVTTVSKDLVAALRPAETETAPGEAAAAGGDAAPARSGGAVRTREDALRQLLQLADYFRSNEPQSPIAASLEDAVRRARMSFADLLAELLPDESAWRVALTNAGIRPPAPPAEG